MSQQKSSKDVPVLTPEISKSLAMFQREHVWAFDSQLDEIKDFIILYYSDEAPEEAMTILGNVLLMQKALRSLLPEES